MNNDPYRELVAKADRHHQHLGSLEEKLRDRTGNLNDIRDRLRKLETNIGEHSIRTIVNKIDDVAKKLGKTSSRLDDQSAKIAELRRNIETLHRKIRVRSRLPHADFDTWQQEISPEMITSIREGLASTPVSETKLRQLRKKQEGAKKELVQWDESLQTAIRAVRVLTALPPVVERAWRKEARTWLAFRDRGPDRSRSRSKHVNSATTRSALMSPRRRPPPDREKRTTSPVRRSGSG